MKLWATLAAIAAAIAALVYFDGAGKRRHDVYSYRYKLSISVDTPDGLKSGETVVEVADHRHESRDGDRYDNIIKITGEALYLDLGPGRKPLVALLTSRTRPTDRAGEIRKRCWQQEYPACWKRLYGITTEYDRGRPGKGWNEFLALRGPRPIVPADLPDLVTFDDINDPKSVIAVDHHDLEATLGPGVSWGPITLEITDEPVSEGIEKWLKWLTALNGGYLHGGFTSREAPLGLHAGNFKSGK